MLPCGMIALAIAPMVVPTPAAANTAPSAASICGSTAAQPIEVDSRLPSSQRREGGRAKPGIADDQRDDHAEPEQHQVTDLGSIRPLSLSGV